MEHMPLTNEEKEKLIQLALYSIENGIEAGEAFPVDSENYSTNLQKHKSSFVTLYKNGKLKGCIGRIKAERPLVVDVVDNAYSAAFSDSRFSKIRSKDLHILTIQISVLSPLENITFLSEQDLIDQIRPGIDGLILKKGANQGTFLPQVWENLPRSESFLRQLKQKAGLKKDYWSDKIRIQRYTTISFQS